MRPSEQIESECELRKQELVEVFQSAYFHTGALTLVHGMIGLIDVLKELEAEKAKKPAASRKRKGRRRA